MGLDLPSGGCIQGQGAAAADRRGGAWGSRSQEEPESGWGLVEEEESTGSRAILEAEMEHSWGRVAGSWAGKEARRLWEVEEAEVLV